MKETNLMSSPRLIGRCCPKEYLYSKTTLMLLIFMLPLFAMAQEQLTPEQKQQKEANHQAYLNKIYGNKPEADLREGGQVSKTKELTETDKQQMLEDAAYEELIAKFKIDKQEYLDRGFTKADIQAEIDRLIVGIENPRPADNSSIYARSGGSDACADAVTLQCGETTFGDTFNASSEDFDGFGCGSVFVSGPGVWYTLVGNGNNNTVSAVTTTPGFVPSVHVYTSGGDCTSLQCYNVANQGTDSVTFYTAFMDIYYVYVTGNQDLGTEEAMGGFNITRTSLDPITGEPVECFDTPAGDGLSSDTAYEIACGNTATGSTVGAAPTEVPSYCSTTAGSTGVWYQFTVELDQPEDITVSLCGSDFDNSVNVYKGTPGSLTCVGGASYTYECTGSYSNVAAYVFDSPVYAGETYYIYISNGYGTATGYYELELICDGDGAIQPPSVPANDLCPDAIEMICGETYQGQNIAATTADEPSTGDCSGSISSNSPGVWYKYTGDGSVVTVSTCGFDTELFAYTGTCGAFTCVDDNDDTSVIGCTSSSESQVSFETIDGEEYYFYVVGWDGNTGEFTITLECEGPLENDDCDGAIEAFCGDELSGNMTVATQSAAPTCSSFGYSAGFLGNGVWYKFTGTGFLTTFDTDYSAFDTKLFVYTGSCGALSCFDFDDDSGEGLRSSVTFSSTLGEEYYIYVSTYSTSTSLNGGSFNFNVTCQADPCEEAETIACGETATGTTLGGSTAGPTDYCGTSPGSTGVYYRYVGTDEFVTASLCNSDYDTKINVYQGSCGSLSCIGGNNDSCGTRSEFAWFAGTGEEYYIWVSGDGETGDYELTMSCQDPEPNDLCGDAIQLSCDVTITGSTLLSSDRDAPPADCDGQFSSFVGAGVWYTITGTGGEIEASTCNDNSFDTKILVLTGECGDLTCYAGNDDGPSCPDWSSQVTFATEEGETYYIYVTGFTGFIGDTDPAITGDFELTIDCLCAPSQEGPECVTIYDGYDDPTYSETTLTGEILYAETPITYEWSNGDTTQSTTVYAADGSQNYTVTMTGADGCSTTQEFFVYVMDVNCDTKGTDKVELCHNGQTICVSPNAVDTHLQHGDVLGVCDAPLCDAVAPVCDVVIVSPADGDTDVDNQPTIEWSVATGLVDGYHVTIVDANSVVVVDADAGNSLSYEVGVVLEYDTQYYVTVTPYNGNGSALGCQPSSFVTELDPSIVPCDTEPVNLTYCYSNNEDTSWYYQSSTPGEPLTLVFNSGGIEGSSFDFLKIYDGTDASGTLLYENPTSYGVNLSGVTVTSPSGNIFMTLVSDPSVSCYGGSWDIDISCGEIPVTCYDGDLNLEVVLDYWGSETTWEIVDSGNNQLYSGGPYSDYSPDTTYNYPINLSNGEFTLKVYDEYGDGISYNGITLTEISSSDEIAYVVGNFGDETSVDFCIEGSIFSRAAISDNQVGQTSDWSMAPNPTKGNVTLDLTNYLQSDVTIDVMSVTGKVVYTAALQNLKGSKYDVELNNSLPAGMYFVRVAASGQVSTKKLMIMR